MIEDNEIEERNGERLPLVPTSATAENSENKFSTVARVAKVLGVTALESVGVGMVSAGIGGLGGLVGAEISDSLSHHPIANRHEEIHDGVVGNLLYMTLMVLIYKLLRHYLINYIPEWRHRTPLEIVAGVAANPDTASRDDKIKALFNFFIYFNGVAQCGDLGWPVVHANGTVDSVKVKWKLSNIDMGVYVIGGFLMLAYLAGLCLAAIKLTSFGEPLRESERIGRENMTKANRVPGRLIADEESTAPTVSL